LSHGDSLASGSYLARTPLPLLASLETTMTQTPISEPLKKLPPAHPPDSTPTTTESVEDPIAAVTAGNDAKAKPSPDPKIRSRSQQHADDKNSKTKNPLSNPSRNRPQHTHPSLPLLLPLLQPPTHSRAMATAYYFQWKERPSLQCFPTVTVCMDFQLAFYDSLSYINKVNIQYRNIN
jgi:hypothetical protein